MTNPSASRVTLPGRQRAVVYIEAASRETRQGSKRARLDDQAQGSSSSSSSSDTGSAGGAMSDFYEHDVAFAPSESDTEPPLPPAPLSFASAADPAVNAADVAPAGNTLYRFSEAQLATMQLAWATGNLRTRGKVFDDLWAQLCAEGEPVRPQSLAVCSKLSAILLRVTRSDLLVCRIGFGNNSAAGLRPAGPLPAPLRRQRVAPGSRPRLSASCQKGSSAFTTCL